MTVCARPSWTPPPAKPSTSNGLQKELNLSPVQSEQIQSVLNDFWQYYRTVMSESKQQVDQLLTDDQRRKFDHLLQQQLAR